MIDTQRDVSEDPCLGQAVSPAPAFRITAKILHMVQEEINLKVVLYCLWIQVLSFAKKLSYIMLLMQVA